MTNLILLEGETKKHYRVSIGDPIIQSFDPATFSARKYHMAPALLFVGFNFAEPTFSPL